MSRPPTYLFLLNMYLKLSDKLLDKQLSLYIILPGDKMMVTIIKVSTFTNRVTQSMTLNLPKYQYETT